MNSRKKSILIALCIGDGYITHQKQVKKGRTYQYNYLEISHGQYQEEYIKWKANLCTSITGKRCRVRTKFYKEKSICGNKPTPSSIGYTFTCSAPYFRVLRKWLYPNNQKKLSIKYLNYLDPEGLAIWFCDDGSTYVNEKRKNFSVEISTHVLKEETSDLIQMFKDKWNIDFHLHKKAEDQYNIRAFAREAFKFIQLIAPFVPNCMAYKLRVPVIYLQECSASHLNKLKGMKIYSEQ